MTAASSELKGSRGGDLRARRVKQKREYEMQSVPKSIIPTVNRRALSLVAAGFSAVLMTGCATSPVSKVGASTKVEYYPTCYEPVQHLRDSDANVTKSVAGGAAMGAVGGALVGVLSGDGEHRVRNAAIGAAGGGVVGGDFAGLGNLVDGYRAERNRGVWRSGQVYSSGRFLSSTVAGTASLASLAMRAAFRRRRSHSTAPSSSKAPSTHSSYFLTLPNKPSSTAPK